MNLASLVRPLGRVRRLPKPQAPLKRLAPREVAIPLEYPGQVIFEPEVSAGDRVQRGQRIGKSALGNAIHASLSGTVRDIVSLWSPQSVHVPAVVIEGEMDEVQTEPQRQDLTQIRLWRACGVVCPWTLPGKGYREEELSGLPEVEHVFFEGVNEEPSIFVFEQLLEAHSEQIVDALVRTHDLLAKASVHLTVPSEMKDWARTTFGQHASVVPRRDDYRARLSRVLVPRVTGKRIPHTHSFRRHGVAVLSIEDALNMATAYDHGKPVVDKHVTVAGYGLAQPVTVQVPIGTRIRDVVFGLGLDPETVARIVVGGPMKGHAQFTLDTPLTKFDHGLFLMGRDELPLPAHLTCVNCGRCVNVCPVHLAVNMIGRAVEFDLLEDARRLHAEACIGCGLCTYVCPAHRPLRQLVGMVAKGGE